MKFTAVSMDTKALFANLNQLVTVNAIAALANVCATIWFARVLGPAVLGDYAVLLVIFQFLTALLVPGFNQALIREPNRKELVAAATVATCAQSLMIVALGGIFFLYSSWSTTEQMQALLSPAVWLGSGLVLSSWSNLLASPLEAELAYGTLSRIRIVALVGGIAVGFVGAAQEWGIYALVLRDFVTAMVTLALVKRASPLVVTWQGWKEGVDDLLRFSGGLWVLNALEKVALRLDYAIVGMVFEKEVLGIYFAVRGLIEGALGFLVSPIQTLLYSFYCRIRLSPVQLWPTMSKVAGGIVSGVLVLECLCLFIGPWFVKTALSERYGSGDALLMGLVLYAGAMLWFESVKVWAMSWSVHRTMVIPRVVQLAAIMAVTFPLIEVAGLRGAGWSAGLSACVLAMIATWQVYRHATIQGYHTSHGNLEERAA